MSLYFSILSPKCPPVFQQHKMGSSSLSLFHNTRKPELDREGKGNLDVTGLEILVYRANQVIFYLVERIATPLNKCGAGLSVPEARHSAPAGHSWTTAMPCVPRLARRGGTSPSRGHPAAPPSSPTLPWRQRLPRSVTDCASVGQWVICLSPGQRATLTCSHRHQHRGSEAGAQP